MENSTKSSWLSRCFGPLNERSKNAGGMPCASSFDRQRDIPLPFACFALWKLSSKMIRRQGSISSESKNHNKELSGIVSLAVLFFFFRMRCFFCAKNPPPKRGRVAAATPWRWHGLWSCIELWDLLFLQDAFWEPRINRWKTSKKTSGSVKCWWFLFAKFRFVEILTLMIFCWWNIWRAYLKPSQLVDSVGGISPNGEMPSRMVKLAQDD